VKEKTCHHRAAEATVETLRVHFKAHLGLPKSPPDLLSHAGSGEIEVSAKVDRISVGVPM
jgi:hypothetical protein